MTNKPNGTLYIGVSSRLVQRVYEHKTEVYENSFSAKYSCKNLVYYEIFTDIRSAIKREKQLKKVSRKKKIALIETINPNWQDLYSKISRY
tara:strand:+ start:259 stop:531 length:273 start_codon:yes stop_codon:yes gene_type:complete